MHLLKLTLILLVSTFVLASEGKTESQTPKGIYYGKILEIKAVMGYKYLKVNEDGKELWVAIANAPVKVGEKIGYDKNTIMKNFKSKSLNQEFEEIIFASDVYLAQKSKKATSMKEMLGLDAKEAYSKDPHKGMAISSSHNEDEEKPAKPFVKKDFYTVEEVYMWKKSLKGQKVKVKGTVFKVSHQIMKLDWVHIGDGTGDEKKITDDLVFTLKSSSLKAGDKVIASGEVVVDKDFGFGYFYKAIIKDATFEEVK
jgi:hypothetical protein